MVLPKGPAKRERDTERQRWVWQGMGSLGSNKTHRGPDRGLRLSRAADRELVPPVLEDLQHKRMAVARGIVVCMAELRNMLAVTHRLGRMPHPQHVQPMQHVVFLLETEVLYHIQTPRQLNTREGSRNAITAINTRTADNCHRIYVPTATAAGGK